MPYFLVPSGQWEGRKEIFQMNNSFAEKFNFSQPETICEFDPINLECEKGPHGQLPLIIFRPSISYNHQVPLSRMWETQDRTPVIKMGLELRVPFTNKHPSHEATGHSGMFCSESLLLMLFHIEQISKYALGQRETEGEYHHSWCFWYSPKR